MFRRRNALPGSDREAFTFADSSDDDDEPEHFFVFMALLHQLRRRLLCHPQSFILRMELTRRLSAIPRLAADVERSDPLVVLANLYLSFPDAFLERICGRDMLEEFGLVEARRPASPTRPAPPPRSHSPPSASIVSRTPSRRNLSPAADAWYQPQIELEELQATDSTASADVALTSEQPAVPVAEDSAPSQDSDFDDDVEGHHAEPIPANKRKQPRRTRSKRARQGR
jgi:hypothetical protein